MTSELKSMLDTMSMAELAKYPAGTPPAGQTSNLVDPPSIAYLFLIVGSVVMSIMYITMGLSLYAKIFVRKRMAPDDWARLISMVRSLCLLPYACPIDRIADQTLQIGATCYFITCVFGTCNSSSISRTLC